MRFLSTCRLLAVSLALPLAAPYLLACSGGDDGNEPVPWVQENQNQPENQTSNQNQNHGEPREGINVITLLSQEVEINNSYSAPIHFEAPDDVYSIAITVSGGPAAAQYTVTNWVGPGEFPIIRNGWESQGMCYPNCNNRVALNPAAASALAPNNPASRAEPGPHRFQVAGFTQQGFSMGSLNGTVQVKVEAKTVSDEVPDTGTLDLNIFFTGSNGWSAASAPNNAAFTAMMNEVEQLFSQAGISIGDVSYNDIPTTYQVIQDVLSPDGDLGRMFGESSGAPLDGINLFFVTELRSFFGEILGIAGGIPGPILVDGTYRSGVAVATASAGQPGYPSLAHTTVHELGHYLGLFHTTENFQQPGSPGHDPLPDTPQNDPSYLMHASGAGNNISPWQGRVMRKNMFTRHN